METKRPEGYSLVSKIPQPHQVDEIMHSLWVAFHVYLGLPCDENVDPKIGFWFEKNIDKRDEFLGRAIRMRNKYAALVTRFHKGRDQLTKMTVAISQIRGDSLEPPIEQKLD